MSLRSQAASSHPLPDMGHSAGRRRSLEVRGRRQVQPNRRDPVRLWWCTRPRAAASLPGLQGGRLWLPLAWWPVYQWGWTQAGRPSAGSSVCAARPMRKARCSLGGSAAADHSSRQTSRTVHRVDENRGHLDLGRPSGRGVSWCPRNVTDRPLGPTSLRRGTATGLLLAEACV